MLKGSRLRVVLPTLGRPWTAKVLATEALLGAAKPPTRARAGEGACTRHLAICQRHEDFGINLPATVLWPEVKKGRAADSQAPNKPRSNRCCDEVYFVRFELERTLNLEKRTTD